MPLLSDEDVGLTAKPITITPDPNGAYFPQSRPLLSDADVGIAPFAAGDTGGPGTTIAKGGLPRTVMAAAAPQQAQEPTWTQTFQQAKQNLPSPVDYIKSQLTNPITDVANLGKVVLGAAENAIGPEKFAPYSNEQELARAFINHYRNYFSEKGLKENISQRPVETATDILSLATPGGIARAGARAPEIAATDVAAQVPRTAEQLLKSGGQGIKTAKASQVYIDPSVIRGFGQGLAESFLEAGLDPNVIAHQPARSAIEWLDQIGQKDKVSFSDIHILRQRLNAAARSNDATVRAFATTVKHGLDDFVTEISKIPNAIRAEGKMTPQQATQLFHDSIREYAAAKKAQEIQVILDKANVHSFIWSQSGVANAIRTKFRQLYNSDKRLRTYTPEQRKLIKDILTGNLTDKFLTLASKFALRGPVSAGIAHVLGGGFLGQAGLHTIGELAQRGLNRRLETKIEKLRENILIGGDTKLKDLIGEAVYDHLNQSPQGKFAIARWLRSGGEKGATKALSFTIAQAVKRPDLQPRIEQEISGLAEQQGAGGNEAQKQ